MAFTTGSNAAGYLLKHVNIESAANTSGTTAFGAAIHADSSGTPGASLGTLTNPTLPSSWGLAQFTASGTGIALAASTTYHLVLSGDRGSFRVTSSDAQTGLTGWSIADTGQTAGRAGSSVIKMAVHGVVKTVPTVANAIPDQSATEGRAFSFQFAANAFNDADGDTLTYTAAKSDDTALPMWLTFTAGTRTFSGTPPTTAIGTLSVKVTASDGTNSVSDTFDIVVRTNQAPTVSRAIPDQHVKPGNALNYTFPTNTFNDADGDTLTYTATKSDDTGLPTWLTFTPGTRTFSGTPATTDTGTVSVKVTASDGLASVSDTFDIVVSANSPPTVANAIPEQAATVGVAFSYTFPANTFADADGDTLTYTALQPGGIPLPTWLTFNAGTRTFSGTPPSDTNVGIDVNASDGRASSPAAFFWIVVSANSPPTVANPIPQQTAYVGRAFSYTFPANTFADAEGDTLTYTALQPGGIPLPTWLTFTPGTRTFSGTPPSDTNIPIDVNAHDGFASSPAAFFWIAVSAAPPPPPPDTTPPRVSGTPAVTGAALTIVFNERLARGAVPASAFEVVADGGAGVTPSAVEVDHAVTRRQVTLTLPEPVAHGQTVEVRYTRPAARNERLRDFSGNAVADFTRTVTNETPAPPPGSPVADAGADLEVDPGAAVTLDGSASADPDGDALAWAWTQTAGTTQQTSGARVALEGADTAMPSFTAPARPGVMVFRLTVTDPGGLSTFDDVTVTVRDLAPRFAAPAPALALVLDEPMAPVVLPEATGGNGTLSYALTSDPAGLAGLEFDAATRTLSGTPSGEGGWTFTWRADDADDNMADADAAVLTFAVSVEDARTARVKRTVKRTLAAVARRALTSALDNIGARFAAAVPASGLTLAGETVPLGTSGAGAGTGLAGMDQTCASGRHGFDDASGRAFGRTGPGASGGGCASVARSRTVAASELLHASAFSLTLGAAEGSGMPSSAPLWSVWGRGDLGTFAGRPDGMRYEGELRTGWLGIDARAGPWVAGLAVSHGVGEADYSFGEAGVSGRGRLETELTAFYPYGRWTVSDGLELRGVLGAGRGEAAHRLDGGARETSDLSMWMGSAGLRQELAPLAGIDLAVRADASLARMETEDGPDYVDGLTADSWRLRAGLEASRRIALDGEAALVPFVEAAARRDGGDGLEGTGLEVAGGLRYEAPGLHLEARGRWLAAHTEEGAEERGVSVTARMGPGAHGRGLSLMLNPRWGAGTGGAEALWRDDPPGPGAASGGDAAALDARIGYGVGVAPYGLLTPFAETGLAGEGDTGRLRLGLRFAATHMDLGVEVAGERREGGAAGTEHLLRLDLGLRF